ncbi:MAG: hypothetical protein JO303_07625 [Caulobacteraceae bacterium]|nr:hypothetical protein [Caulobacteraceae bacterium]
MSRRKATLRAPAARISINGQALTLGQEQLWRAANSDLGSADFARRRHGSMALRRIEGELAEGQAAEAVRRGLKETVALERARGETVEALSRPGGRGRVRVRSRDGLETLERSGAITALQYRAGLLYRDLYEATDPERDLRSQMASPALAGAGAKGPPGRAEAWAERRLRLAASMAALEAKVRTHDRNGRAVRALREVAGDARCISHFVKGGGGQAAYRRALVLALEVCVGHFGL